MDTSFLRAPMQIGALGATRSAASPLHLQRFASRPHQQLQLARAAAVATNSATEPLTRDDLVKYLASGCKPRDKWR